MQDAYLPIEFTVDMVLGLQQPVAIHIWTWWSHASWEISHHKATCSTSCLISRGSSRGNWNFSCRYGWYWFMGASYSCFCIYW